MQGIAQLLPAVRTPPAGLNQLLCQHPYRGSLEALIPALSSVALTGTLPVDVLIKSAPALIEISDALRMSAASFNSPVSIITFSKEPALAQASLHAV